MEFLDALYRDPKEGFIGVKKLYKKAKLYNPSITLKRVKEWFAKHPELRQYSDQKSHFDEFKIASHIPNSWQMDLMFRNKEVVLTAINIYSRLGYTKLLKDKTANEVLKALKQFAYEHKITILTTDNGTEFTNKKLRIGASRLVLNISTMKQASTTRWVRSSDSIEHSNSD